MLSHRSTWKQHLILIGIGLWLGHIQCQERQYKDLREVNRQQYTSAEPKYEDRQNKDIKKPSKPSIYDKLKYKKVERKPQSGRPQSGQPQSGRPQSVRPQSVRPQSGQGRGDMGVECNRQQIGQKAVRRLPSKKSTTSFVVSQSTYDSTDKMYGYVNGMENYKEIVNFDPRGVFSCCYKKNGVALTYDDGPSEFTAQLLDILAKENVKATFFILGERLKDSYVQQELLKRIYREGHTIGSHGWSHTDFRTLSAKEIRDELQNTSTVIYRLIGVYPIYFRPPYGYMDERVKSIVFNMGFKIVTWNLDCQDWDIGSRSPAILVSKLKNILKHFHPVQNYKSWIFLQHDIFKSTVDVQKEIIKIFKMYGYQFFTLRECVGIDYGPYA